MIGAGMETTTSFIRWAIVLLTNHVSVQERLHADIDSVVGRQRLPTVDDRLRSSKLVYRSYSCRSNNYYIVHIFSRNIHANAKLDFQ